MTQWQRAITGDYGVVGAPSRAHVAARAAGVVVFAALTWIGANIYIPLEPVPITLQTLFVLLAGSVIGGRFGALSQSLYVAGGALGLPIFAGGVSGWGILAGPTGGFLVSFLVAPFVVSALLSRTRSKTGHVLAFVAGTVTIFLFGVGHLALFYTHDLALALRVGFLPFIPGAVLKVIAAASISGSYAALVRYRASKRAS